MRCWFAGSRRPGIRQPRPTPFSSRIAASPTEALIASPRRRIRSGVEHPPRPEFEAAVAFDIDLVRRQGAARSAFAEAYSAGAGTATRRARALPAKARLATNNPAT